MSHSQLVKLALTGCLGWWSYWEPGRLNSPIRLTRDFHSCTVNHVNCPRGFTIFPQLLDNFLLVWHFTACLFMFYVQPGLTRFKRRPVSLFFAQDAVTSLGDAEVEGSFFHSDV